ncbi:hypothetical protein KIH41_00920 [Litoribacter ruber]|uniref:hypothetical protein n=1 Tax=Litoribacter ruber TaxID=702568 RepID=UPI001BDB3BB9|nr:hypothetical protein [Litoribacter ruber]MBT0809836.1 hypothetical protein [Litoribacter ruber]
MSSPIYLLLICLSALVALGYLIQKQSSFQKSEVLLLICLILVFIFETLNQFLITKAINKNIMYTLSWFYVVPAILTYYFSQQLPILRNRVLVIGIMILMLLIPSMCIDWQTDVNHHMHYINYLPLWTLVLILAGKSLYKNLTSQEFADQNLLSISNFWVSIGVIIFYLESIFMLGILYMYPQAEISLIQTTLSFSHSLGGLMLLIIGMSLFAPTLFAKTYKFS